MQNTNNELVRRAAGVSGSQLSRHFPTKESLVRAVITWRPDLMIKSHQDSLMSLTDSFAALRRWADGFIAREEPKLGGARSDRLRENSRRPTSECEATWTKSSTSG